ncbi:F-box/LRR-repeat protein 17 [Tanacetum coccineum]
MKEEDADLDEIQPSETKNSEEYDLSFKFMMIIEPPLPPIDDKHENDKDANFSQAVEALTRLFPDVHGRMTELCRPTQKKYTLVVTVAMGRFMDDVVLEKNKLEFWNCFQPPNLNEIALKFSCQENDSTDVTSMMDGFGRSCPKLQIASLQLSRSVVLSLTAANLRGLRMLSLAFGPEVTDASVIMDCELSSISDSGIGMICNVFPDTLTRLLVSQCSYITSSGIQFATAQLPLLELMDSGMTICEPDAQSPLCEANNDSDSQVSNDPVPSEDNYSRKRMADGSKRVGIPFSFSQPVSYQTDVDLTGAKMSGYNGIIRNTDLSDYAYAIEDNSIHHECQYRYDFSETDYSMNFNDILSTCHVGECNHCVEELDKDFINETNEENKKESSQEEMI